MIKRTRCARYLSLRRLVSHAIARSKVRHAVVHSARAHAVPMTPDLPDLTPAPPLGVSVCPRFPTAALKLCEAVGCVTSAKDMVALNLAHKCDELESQLEPFKSLSQDSALTLGAHKPAQANLQLAGPRQCVCVPRSTFPLSVRGWTTIVSDWSHHETQHACCKRSGLKVLHCKSN